MHTHHTEPTPPVNVELDQLICVIDVNDNEDDCPNPVVGYILTDGQFNGVAYCRDHRDEAETHADAYLTGN